MSNAFAAPDITFKKYGESFEVVFLSLRNREKLLSISRQPAGSGTKRASYTIRFHDMDFVGEVIQHMAHTLGVSELACSANFVEEMKEFQKTLYQVDDYNGIRLKLTAEMADNSGLVKNLVIKAEDARILGDMRLMRKMYHDLFTANADLIREYMKRATNHQNLLGALKTVNLMIQKAVCACVKGAVHFF